MKKVVYIVESLEKGVGKHIQDLYLNLSKDREFEIFILYGEERADKEILAKFNFDNLISIKNLKRKIGMNDIKAIFEIKRHLKKIKPDIVHCHSSKAGVSGRISAKISGVKNILYSPHAYFFLKFDVKSFKRKLFIFAEKMLSRFFTSFTITTSKGEDDDFLKYKIDKESKRILIEHGVEVIEISDNERNELRNQINVNDKQILIGGMARLEEQKDPMTMLNIMQKLMKRNENIKCIIWGTGSLFEKMNEINEQSKVKIILAGETTEPDKCLSLLDIYLTTSLYEGLPYTLLESLGLGLPIVATNVEGNKDCVVDNKNGKLFTVKNEEEACLKIESLIKENKFEEYSKESRTIFNNRFSIRNMIIKYKGVYSKGQMKKIIILGCGYIGTNIANFIKTNYESDVYVWGLENEYVNFLQKGITFIDKYSEEIDDSDKELFRNAIVVDALGNINATNVAQNVNFLVLQNCESKFNLINKLLKFKINKYIYLSSGGTVYSDSELMHEENEKIEPLSIYALEKCIIENYLKIISMENHEFTYLILRLSNPYGGVCAKNKKQGIIDVSINKIMNNETLELYGELTNVRDYIFIDNVAEYIYKLGISNKKNEIFNVGSGIGTSINEIIRTIERIVNKKLMIDIQQSRTTNIKCNILNINKLRNVVELENIYTIEKGIERIINSYKL